MRSDAWLKAEHTMSQAVECGDGLLVGGQECGRRVGGPRGHERISVFVVGAGRQGSPAVGGTPLRCVRVGE